MVARVLMVLAAALMVIGFAVATFVPPDMPLGQFLLQQDHGSVARLRAATLPMPGFVWTGIVVPMLLRPAWLPPLMLAIVALGGAITLRPRASVPRRPPIR